MASAAAGESIMFIGAVLASMVVATTLGTIAMDYSSTLKDRSGDLAQSYREDVEVVSDPANVLILPFRLYIKNTGSVDFATSQLTIIVDGTASLVFTVTVGGLPATVIGAGDLALVTIVDIAPAVGDHHVVIMAGNAAVDTFDFTR